MEQTKNLQRNSNNELQANKVKNFVRKRAGKLVDYYRVGKELGKGAFGSVRRVVHIETGDRRAVKVIEKT